MKGLTLSEVSSVMNCEALAFVAAQLHAAKCVQRYKCSEIAQALKETLCFLFVLFVISVNIRLIVCSRFIAKNVSQITSELYSTEIHFQGLALLDQAEDWSTLLIGVSYGTILTLSNVATEEEEERVERKKDNRIVAAKES